MCFSPKVKMPKVNTQQMRAQDPAPLAEQVQGVQFGGSGNDDEDTGKETSSEVKTTKKSGKSSLKIELSKDSSKGGAKRSSVKSRMGK